MSDYWQDKAVCVVGGAGMVGSVLAEFLHDAGAEVLILDNMSRGKFWAPRLHYIEFPYNDATVQSNCELAFEDMDVVFNLAAAVGGLYHNLDHQLEQFWENMKLQTTPAIAAAKVGVPVFLQTSTVCVYARGWNNPAVEVNGAIKEPERGNAGYAWAKRMGERVCVWAFKNTDAKYVIVRPTNIYGPRDYFGGRAHVIPALIAKFLDGMDPVTVYGGDQRREFIYSEDVARGMMTIAEKGHRGGIYNLGTHGETQVTIRELAEMIKDACGSDAKIAFVKDKPTGDQARSTNCDLAHALGWHHEVSLADGLSRVVEWYV